MLRTRNLTLTSTPQELTIDDDMDTPNTISIQNTDSLEPIYIGSESVTTSSYGIKLAAGQTFSAELAANDQIYAVGSGPVAVMILER